MDASTPVLNAVIVEGVIIWSDEADYTFDAYFLLIRGGKIIIGTESQPYTHKLVITMHGELTGKQLPEFGNKVIGCHHCTLDIHGTRKTPTWTELASTANVGAKSITLMTAVNWSVGDEIVIASTDYDYNQAEVRRIATISGDGLTITFADALLYKHYAAVESYTDYTGTAKNVPIRAEVGVLTRNIIIKGDDSSSKT